MTDAAIARLIVEIAAEHLGINPREVPDTQTALRVAMAIAKRLRAEGVIN